MRLVVRIVLFVVLAIGAGIGFHALDRWQSLNDAGPSAADKLVMIPKGMGTNQIANLLQSEGIIDDPLAFRVMIKLEKLTLKAGEYAFAAGISPRSAAQLLADGKNVVHRLTLAEGLSVKQTIALINNAEFMTGTITRLPTEGMMLPDTWHMTRGDDRQALVDRMEKSMATLLDELWAKRAPDLPLKSKEEALVLASIVERETAVAAERPLVAGVFINRLRRGMRLQSDPTVIYGVSDGLGVLDRPIYRRDLENPHPWNTYVIDRLPPTPIANPGRHSLAAVLNPAQTDAFYFVADGTGGHAFARTLDEHNRNVAKWRAIERARKQ